MAILHLEVKYIKRQKNSYPPEYYSHCPVPQNNADCQGIYIKTRRWQHECTACLKLHGTIDKHPLLKALTTPVKVIFMEDAVIVSEFDTLKVLTDNISIHVRRKKSCKSGEQRAIPANER